MTPFYADDLITLYHTKCEDFMAECADKQFDLAIVDVPYGIKESSKVLSRPEWVKQKSGNSLFVPHKYKVKDWDNEKPKPKYFKELRRISQNQIIWGANHFGNMPPSPSWIVWDKVNGDSDFADCELAYHLHIHTLSPVRGYRIEHLLFYNIQSLGNYIVHHVAYNGYLYLHPYTFPILDKSFYSYSLR